MSEYLDRLKHLRDATPSPGNAPNVQSNVSFRRAIEYIEKLEQQRRTDRVNLIKKINNINVWIFNHGAVVDTIAKHYGFK